MNENLELNLELELQAWLDGELSATKARQVEPKIVGDENASRLVAELKSVKTDLHGNETARKVPESREFYFSKIQREIQRQSPPTQIVQAAPRAAWSKWLVPFLGAASLGCLLLMSTDPFSEPTVALDETSPVADGTEAVTFQDQAAGMTVVWLTDSTEAQAVVVPAATAPPTGAEAVQTE